MKIVDVKYQWGNEHTKRDSTEYIVLHHRAGNGDADSIHMQHINQGYTGIGYHFYVRKDGTVYRGRPIDAMGAHCLGSNSNSIGVCFEGNFESERSMAMAQVEAGQKLVSYLKGLYSNAEIKQHKDLYKTACPGKNFPFETIKKGEITVTIDEAKKIIKEKAKLENETINFLLCYKYGDELVVKLAKAIKGA